MEIKKKQKHDIYRTPKYKKKNRKKLFFTLGSIVLIASASTALAVGVVFAKEAK